nr:uncharacterized protein LOC121502135 [Drosophila kikkawai]
MGDEITTDTPPGLLYPAIPSRTQSHFSYRTCPPPGHGVENSTRATRETGKPYNWKGRKPSEPTEAHTKNAHTHRRKQKDSSIDSPLAGLHSKLAHQFWFSYPPPGAGGGSSTSSYCKRIRNKA